MPQRGDWHSYTARNAPESARAAAQREPVAQVEIVIYGLNPGQSEVRISAASNGPLAALRSTQQPARENSYRQLYAAAVRELNNAIQLLDD